jgi:FkbM family methyltransferase
MSNGAPRPIVKAAMRLVRSTLKHFGYGLVRLEYAKPSYGLDCLFPLLKQRGFAPRHILDVGANRGLWTRTAIEYFPDALYTLIEPQEELESHVQDLVERGFRIVWVNMGAADKSGLLPLTVSPRDDSGSFRFGDEQPDPAGCRRVLVTVRTLDEILSSLGAPIPDMVKIDAEGFDLRVLRGASGLLGKTEIFFVEATVRDNWENSVLQVVQRMSDSGYSLLDVTDLNRSRKFGFLWLMELAFVRNGATLLNELTYE